MQIDLMNILIAALHIRAANISCLFSRHLGPGLNLLKILGDAHCPHNNGPLTEACGSNPSHSQCNIVQLFKLLLLSSLLVLIIILLLLNWNRKCSGMGAPIGDGSQDTICTLLFADDPVLITQEYEHMEFMVRKLFEEYEKWSLKINLEKTFYMGCGAATKDLLILEDQKGCIRECEEYKYLGEEIDKKDRQENDIKKYKYK